MRARPNAIRVRFRIDSRGVLLPRFNSLWCKLPALPLDGACGNQRLRRLRRYGPFVGRRACVGDQRHEALRCVPSSMQARFGKRAIEDLVGPAW